ncbi:hypothetical protein LXL04_028847 [Taraxacum kok-saghyz]
MVRKLMDKMTKEGFIETSSSRRLGKRVVHSEITNKKLDEVRKALDFDASENLAAGTNRSTVGAFHSIGSERSRSTGRPELQQSVSNTHNNNTPTSNNQVLQPVSSIESYAGMKRGRNGNQDDKMDSSQTTINKRFKKASTVKEPVVQNMKRQKSQLQEA